MKEILGMTEQEEDRENLYKIGRMKIYYLCGMISIRLVFSYNVAFCPFAPRFRFRTFFAEYSFPR